MSIFKCTIWKISTLVYTEVNKHCKDLVVSLPLLLSINKDENKTRTKPVLVALSEASCSLTTITNNFQEHIFNTSIQEGSQFLQKNMIMIKQYNCS